MGGREHVMSAPYEYPAKIKRGFVFVFCFSAVGLVSVGVRY